MLKSCLTEEEINLKKKRKKEKVKEPNFISSSKYYILYLSTLEKKRRKNPENEQLCERNAQFSFRKSVPYANLFISHTRTYTHSLSLFKTHVTRERVVGSASIFFFLFFCPLFADLFRMYVFIVTINCFVILSHNFNPYLTE